MKFAAEYIELANRISDAIEIPDITGIHLPKIVEDQQKPDEFGFILLADGSAAPFYSTLEDSLQKLWQLYPDGRTCRFKTLDMIDYFNSDLLALKAMALGAFNALSQNVMLRSGYSPLKDKTVNSTGFSQLESGQKIAMVGYFKPLIERLLEQGVDIMVLEKNPARVEVQAGVRLSTDVSDLQSFNTILCTASTLINDSLGDILLNKKPTARLSLIGPSGSGLPDILFDHGVDDVGGIIFHDQDALLAALDQQQPWGHAGNKYQISNTQYPGVDAMLKAIINNSPLKRRS